MTKPDNATETPISNQHDIEGLVERLKACKQLGTSRRTSDRQWEVTLADGDYAEVFYALDEAASHLLALQERVKDLTVEPEPWGRETGEPFAHQPTARALAEAIGELATNDRMGLEQRVRGLILRDRATVRQRHEARAQAAEARVEALEARSEAAVGACTVASKTPDVSVAQAFALTAIDFLTLPPEELEPEARALLAADGAER